MEKITHAQISIYILENEIELSSTQPRLCIPIIERIYRKMTLGIHFSEIKVEGNLICDGHHRYFASLLAKLKIDRIPSKSTSATTVTDWKFVVFVEEDWDTPAKISWLNEQDANFNDISIGDLTELMK